MHCGYLGEPVTGVGELRRRLNPCRATKTDPEYQLVLAYSLAAQLGEYPHLEGVFS